MVMVNWFLAQMAGEGERSEMENSTVCDSRQVTHDTNQYSTSIPFRGHREMTCKLATGGNSERCYLRVDFGFC